MLATNQGRRRELKLSDLRFERDRTQHAKHMLQIELSNVITSRPAGWRDPTAIALKQEIAGRAAAVARLDEEVREILRGTTWNRS